jgi:hypothetical protein
MKNQQLLCGSISFVILFIFSFGCKKSDTSRIVMPTVKCRIATTTDHLYNITNIFSYDDSNKLISLKQTALGDLYTRYFSYKGDSVISYLQAGIDPYNFNILLNNFGLIATEVQAGYGRIDSTTYTYDGNGLLLSSLFHSTTSYFPSTTGYTFIDGDNVYRKYTVLGIVTVDTSSYYTDKPSVPGSFDEYIQLTTYGARIFQNKHLLKSTQSGSSLFQYKYDFDDKGNVSTFYSSYAMTYDTIHFTYTCP